MRDEELLAQPKPRKKSKYKQGFYKPLNPKKYIGDPKRIVYRSSYELKFFFWCDNNPDVLEWQSEEFSIPYVSPLDKKPHRYFVDNKIKIKKANGSIETYLIEIKPQVQTVPPVKKDKVTRSYVRAVTEYAKNQAKWKACEAYCEKMGFKFQILTEKELGIKR